MRKNITTAGTDGMDVSPSIPRSTTVNVDRRGMVFRGSHDSHQQNFFLPLSDPTRLAYISTCFKRIKIK